MGTILLPLIIRIHFLIFNYGDRVANHSQISNAILKWSKQSNKIKVIEYAKSHEGRPLYVAFISSSENLKNLDEIKNQVTKLSDPRITSNGEAKSIIENITCSCLDGIFNSWK